MKKNLLVIFIVICIPGFGQDYFVLQVKGTVKRTKTGVVLKTRDVIKSDEQLTFSTANDAVAVVNPKAGRFILKPGKPTKTNELLAYVKDALSQASSHLSTRSGGFNNVLDFQAYFKDPVLFLPVLNYKVNGTSYPINDDSFFYVEYQYKGEAIPKQLKINRDSLLIFNREELFMVDGSSIDGGSTSNHTLNYFKDGSASLLCTLNFNLTDPAIVKAEVNVLTEALKSTKTKETVESEVLAYLLENYAKVDEGNLKQWLDLK
jgi:hypothetical protein